jgi:hypothetical protein
LSGQEWHLYKPALAFGKKKEEEEQAGHVNIGVCFELEIGLAQLWCSKVRT